MDGKIALNPASRIFALTLVLTMSGSVSRAQPRETLTAKDIAEAIEWGLKGRAKAVSGSQLELLGRRS